MRIATATIAIALSWSVAAAESARPVGENCSLSSPPPLAGEEFNHGVVLRIYPRAKDIGPTYSGCQVLFAPDGPGKWAVVGLTEVVRGDPVRVWSEYERNPARLNCRFERGRVVAGDANTCPAPQYLLVRSLAPGCVARIKDAVAKQGTSAGPLPGCEYE